MNLYTKLLSKWVRFVKSLHNQGLRKKVDASKKVKQSIAYQDQPKLTLIVQFFNKRQNIKSLLAGLRAIAATEIIVIDDGSADGSFEEWLGYLDRPNDFLLRCNDLFEVRTYDRAISMARGEFVCLLQDDDIPPLNDTWVQQALSLFARFPDLLILGGRDGLDLLIPDPVQPGEEPEYRMSGDVAGCPGVNKHRVYHTPRYRDNAGIPFMFAMSVNRAPTFIRRKEFLDIGGIDQSFAPFQCDDDDACIRAWLAGYTVGLYACPFERNIGIGGMRLFNSDRVVKQAEINSQKIYATYFTEIDSGHLQRLVDRANEALLQSTDLESANSEPANSEPANSKSAVR